jgi:LPS-assembly protein
MAPNLPPNARKTMRTSLPAACISTCISLCITLGLLNVPAICAQEVTTSTPAYGNLSFDASLPDDPSTSRFPTATPLPSTAGQKVVIESTTQTKQGSVYTLDGDVAITTESYLIRADKITYDSDTGDVTAEGHLRVTGGPSQQTISASHGNFNLHTETGRFYDVIGSIGIRTGTRATVYTVGNPFLFTGRLVVKTGPESFQIFDGTVTSCQLPNPDWRLSAAKFTVDNGRASANNTVFRLLNVPILYLPYATHPLEIEQRQSGFMVPVFGQSSSKGFILGEEFFLVINRSMDLSVGAEYFSRRGFSQSATFRYKGPGLDFLTVHYSGLLDRGYTPTGGVYTNQGGEDFTLSGRKELSEHTRVAADVEYLSSYIYREAFTDNFNQAVASDIKSFAYGVHENNGLIAGVYMDRYQGLKRVATTTQTEQQVRIFHVPSLDLDMMERRVGASKLLFSAENSIATLKRVQSNFSSNVSERIDIHPKLSLPLSAPGWTFRPTIGVRDTYYSHSRTPAPIPGATPVEIAASTNRALFEAEAEIRPPVLERTFDTSFLQRILGRSVKHTIEPTLKYRFATGVDDFSSILRFDVTDVVADTNEVEYGVTQRLFLRPVKNHPCGVEETPSEPGAQCGGTRESFRWRIAQKRFFNESFGGVVPQPTYVTPPGQAPQPIIRRYVLDSTLDYSGVAFLTEPRGLSPILSEMRLSATEHFDVEWDMNYDTHAGKFTQSNTFINYHSGNYFGGVSHARLNAPGRFTTGTDTSGTGGNCTATSTCTSPYSNFSQLRLLLGYGNPTKPGLSIATNVGLDLPHPIVTANTTTSIGNTATAIQYAAVQTGYNWNCCGFALEYRKFELGPVRNENVYRFNFTLANIGSAGNLRRAERLF